MCGKDGVQMGVYKLKEEHERGRDRNRKRKEKNKHKQERRKLEKRKGVALVTREKTFIVPTLKP